MTRRKIGIPISKVGENSVGLTLNYLEYAAQFGEPVLLLPDSEFRPDLDLLLLTGGADVSTDRYGEMPSYFTGKPDIHKEYFDRVMLPRYIENQTCIMGICRGVQTLNIALGGKLIQHMSHETNKPDDPYKSVHNIKLNVINFWNYQEFAPEISNIRGTERSITYGVNSRHHQAINPRFIGEGLVVLATHEKDHTIELISHETLPIIGIQSHIEDCVDYNTIVLLDNMINRMLETKKSILVSE